MRIVEFFMFNAIGVILLAMFHTLTPLVNMIEDTGLDTTETFVASTVLWISFITLAFILRGRA